MDLSPWRSKTVSLSWRGRSFAFDVSQELFSSNAVDQGSLLLLKALPWHTLGSSRAIVDFGCGYGPLGIVAAASLPAARLTMIDRDALAVAFAAANARANLAGVVPAHRIVVRTGLDMIGADPADLLLWNVPGKAGEPVLQGLCAELPAALAPGGLAALVVVNPLAGLMREAVEEASGVAVTLAERHTAHTVLHVRRGEPATVPHVRESAFPRGVFDREERIIELGDLGYAFKPVYGLPEYDNPDFTSDVAAELLAALGPAATCLVHQPGQGHVALAALLRNQPRGWVLTGRDLLALEATRRNLVINGVARGHVRLEATIGLAGDGEREPVALVIVQLDDQLNPPRVAHLVAELAQAVAPDGQALIAGRSTSVTRVAGAAEKVGTFRARKRLKRHGASAVLLRHVA